MRSLNQVQPATIVFIEMIELRLLNIMSPDEFIQRIIRLYQDARISKYADSKISRGRSHSISSVVEDLFANYLILSDTKIDKILVDQPVFVEGVKSTFYPDITVIRNGKISAFFDLKMDLGWNRNGLSRLCEKDKKLIEDIRSKSCTFKDGSTKEPGTYEISDSAVYDIVIISDQNIAKPKLDAQLKEAELLTDYVKVHILSKNEHPNTYGLAPNELLAKIEIQENAFAELLRRIR